MAKKDQPYGGVYENMDFPAYEYQHYPLMMRKGTGKLAAQLIVNNEAEQKSAEEEGYEAPTRVGPPISLTGQEHDALTRKIALLEQENAALKAGRTPLAPPASTEHPVPLAGAKPAELKPGVALRAPASPSGEHTAASAATPAAAKA